MSESRVGPNPSGLCMCGCGEKTALALSTNRKRGDVEGQPVKYILGHRTKRGVGSRRRLSRGYVRVKLPDHPNADSKGFVYEHTLVAANAMGKPVPPGAEVHHVNGVRWDNRPQNLVVCQDLAYHKLLHKRQRALEACGNANWRSCNTCHQWDDPSAMVPCSGGRSFQHRDCYNSFRRFHAATGGGVAEWRERFAAEVSPAPTRRVA